MALHIIINFIYFIIMSNPCKECEKLDEKLKELEKILKEISIRNNQIKSKIIIKNKKMEKNKKIKKKGKLG